MEDVLKSDVFFFVSTISVVVITILLTIVLVYGIKIFADVKYISTRAKEEGAEVIKDISEIREAYRSGGRKLWAVIGAVLGIISKRRSRKRK